MNPAFPPLAFLDVGGGEMLMIFFVVLLLFGGKKMPEFARGLGKSIREFKKASAGVEEEIKRALEEPAPKPNYQRLPSGEPERNLNDIPHPNETLVEPAPPEAPKPHSPPSPHTPPAAPQPPEGPKA